MLDLAAPERSIIWFVYLVCSVMFKVFGATMGEGG